MMFTLADSTCWSNVTEKVWNYTIGGYQVIKKWLSYREFELLGRPLTPDEAGEATRTWPAASPRPSCSSRNWTGIIRP